MKIQKIIQDEQYREEFLKDQLKQLLKVISLLDNGEKENVNKAKEIMINVVGEIFGIPLANIIEEINKENV